MRSAFIAAALLGLAMNLPAAPGPEVSATLRIAVTIAGVGGGPLTAVTGAPPSGGEVYALKERRLGIRTGDRVPHRIIVADAHEVYWIRGDTRKYVLHTYPEERRELTIARQGWEQTWGNQGHADRVFGTETTPLPSQSVKRAKKFEFSVDVHETGTRQTIAGHDAREVVLTVTAVVAGSPLETSGGWVVTSDLWIADRIPQLDALREFQQQYAAAVSDVAFTGISPDEIARIDATHPEFVTVAARTLAEQAHLDGTVLGQLTKYEMVRTPTEQTAYERAVKSKQASMGGASNVRVIGDVSTRATIVTYTEQCLDLGFSAADAAVTLPSDFKRVSSYAAAGKNPSSFFQLHPGPAR